MNSPAINKSGISFSDARNQLNQAIEETLKEYEKSVELLPIDDEKIQELIKYIILPIISCELVFILSSALGLPSLLISGLVISIIILAFASIINYFIVSRILNTKRREVSSEVKLILDDYKRWIDTCEGFDNSYNNNQQNAIILGYPHVSVVSCYRNGLWQRIPTLLLVEGDIIALMGGDITPGSCVTLLPNNRVNININMENYNSWRYGERITSGQTIRLRRSSPEDHSKSLGGYAQHSFNKHRAMTIDSIELLILSGDIRCFQMTETPIKSFCKNILTESSDNNNNTNNDHSSLYNEPSVFADTKIPETIGECGGQSWIRKLFALIFKLTITVFLPGTMLLFFTAVIIRLSIFKFARSNWTITVSVPIAVIFLVSPYTSCLIVSDL